MKILYLDCNMGASGDMLTGALIELLPDPDAFVARLNALGLPGVSIGREPSFKCGIRGTHISVLIDGEEETVPSDHEHGHDHCHEHDHAHKHTHSHTHRTLTDVNAILSSLPVSQKVRSDAFEVYSLLANAESKAHGVPVGEIHFHEVGTLDAVADVVAVCMLFEEISPDTVVVSPIRVGKGQIACAHGILPVPAPAAAELLRGLPVFAGEYEGEFCTPTGAALVRHFLTAAGEMPQMRLLSIGYGMGRADHPAANCLRAMLGETDGEEQTGHVVEMRCEIDDMTGEEIGFATEQLFDAGALDVFTSPVFMKKNRPGVLLTVLCRSDDRDRLARDIFRHTSTLGVRFAPVSRFLLTRTNGEIETPEGKAHIKRAEGYGVKKEKLEYEDVAALAREKKIGFSEAKKRIEKTLCFEDVCRYSDRE